MYKQIILVLICYFFFFGGSIWAHPGNVASDGCHYCRTNCDRWGVPWNERHCHGQNTDAYSREKLQKHIDYMNSPEGKAESERFWKEYFSSRYTPTPIAIPTLETEPKGNEVVSLLNLISDIASYIVGFGMLSLIVISIINSIRH